MTNSQNTAYVELKGVFSLISNLAGAGSILGKDAQTFMAPGSRQDRSEQLQAIATACHHFITDSKVGKLLDQAEASQATLADVDRRNLSLMRREWVASNSLPPDLAREIARIDIEGESLHTELKPTGDWKKMKPWYEHAFDVARQAGELKKKALPGFSSTYEALMDSFSRGMKDATVASQFAVLEQALPHLIQAVKEKQDAAAPPIPLEGKFPEAQQAELCRRLVQAVGFDFSRGRFDMSKSHPSAGGTSDDKRIIAQCDETDFFSAVYGVVHEAGHGNYAQNLPKEHRYQLVGGDLGMGIHESQSRIIEVMACHTPEFFHFLERQTRDVFGRANDPALSAENLEKLANRVTPSFIRIYADELTYPAHVILRYRLEKSLIEGTMKIDDLQQAWNDGMKKMLGIVPPNPSQGHMQDVHWPTGTIGYFPAYTIGDMGAAQFFAAACKARPDLRSELANGNFKPLNDWLRVNVHSKGALVTPEELFKNATGEGLNAQYYLNHFSERYLGKPYAQPIRTPVVAAGSLPTPS